MGRDRRCNCEIAECSSFLETGTEIVVRLSKSFMMISRGVCGRASRGARQGRLHGLGAPAFGFAAPAGTGPLGVDCSSTLWIAAADSPPGDRRRKAGAREPAGHCRCRLQLDRALFRRWQATVQRFAPSAKPELGSQGDHRRRPSRNGSLGLWNTGRGAVPAGREPSAGRGRQLCGPAMVVGGGSPSVASGTIPVSCRLCG